MRTLLTLVLLVASAVAQTIAGGSIQGGSHSTGPHTVALTWEDSDAGVTFNVYRGTTSDGESLLASGVTAVTWIDLNVVGGTTYYYKVTAVRTSDGAESGYSNETSAVIPSP